MEKGLPFHLRLSGNLLDDTLRVFIVAQSSELRMPEMIALCPL
jgi:hypothetical protein